MTWGDWKLSFKKGRKKTFVLAQSPGKKEVGRFFQQHHLVSTLN